MPRLGEPLTSPRRSRSWPRTGGLMTGQTLSITGDLAMA